MVITYNYSVLMDVLSRSENCSSGNRWLWEHISQCVEQPQHLAGFIIGNFAIVLCAISFLRFAYKYIGHCVKKQVIKNKNVMYYSKNLRDECV